MFLQYAKIQTINSIFAESTVLCAHSLLFDGICHYKLQVYRIHLQPGINRIFVLYFNLLLSFCFQDLVVWLLLFFLSLYGKNDIIVSCPKEEWDLNFYREHLVRFSSMFTKISCLPNLSQKKKMSFLSACLRAPGETESELVS